MGKLISYYKLTFARFKKRPFCYSVLKEHDIYPKSPVIYNVEFQLRRKAKELGLPMYFNDPNLRRVKLFQLTVYTDGRYKYRYVKV